MQVFVRMMGPDSYRFPWQGVFLLTCRRIGKIHQTEAFVCLGNAGIFGRELSPTSCVRTDGAYTHHADGAPYTKGEGGHTFDYNIPASLVTVPLPSILRKENLHGDCIYT